MTFALRLFLALSLLLIPTLTFAQEVPEDAQMDLWCGTAFKLLTLDSPADATEEQVNAAKVFSDAGDTLIKRALPIYLEQGYSDEALAALRTGLEAEIKPIVTGGPGAGKPRYSFEDCQGRIGK
jgi:hypothetical protein